MHGRLLLPAVDSPQSVLTGVLLPPQGRTQYTPRSNYDKSSVTSILKPASDGYIPKNDQKALYDGPDVHNPNYDVPEGQVDVMAVVAGRRRLANAGTEEEDDAEEHQPVLQSVPLSSSSSGSASRQLQQIVPGKGWESTGEPQGLCDGSYGTNCARSGYEECFLIGHHDFRGSVVGNEYSGWLVMNLSNLQQGVIVRPMSGFGLTAHVRISIGLPEENERLVKAIAELRSGAGGGTA